MASCFAGLCRGLWSHRGSGRSRVPEPGLEKIRSQSSFLTYDFAFKLGRRYWIHNPSYLLNGFDYGVELGHRFWGWMGATVGRVGAVFDFHDVLRQEHLKKGKG